MTEAERQFVEDRALRDRARAVFDERVARVRGALGQKGVGPRVRDEAIGRSKAVANEAAEVASEYRWIVAGTLLAVVAWILRRPLATGARHVKQHLLEREPATPWQRCKTWFQQRMRP